MNGNSGKGNAELLKALAGRFGRIWLEAFGREPTELEEKAYLLGYADGIEIIVECAERQEARTVHRTNIKQ